MSNKPSRVIIDTNLWISFLIRGDYSKLDNIILSKKCILVFSDELLAEFLSVVKRPKFRRYFSMKSIEDLLETIQEYGEFINVQTTSTACRDPKDNFLLALAIDANADFLLTGDADLLEIAQLGETKIITITEFLSN